MSDFKFEIGDTVVFRDDAFVSGPKDFNDLPEVYRGYESYIADRKIIFGVPLYKIKTDKYWYPEGILAYPDELGTDEPPTADNIDEPPTADNIDHPSYYNDGIEAIDYIESHHMNFNLGNVIKYTTRAGLKSDDAVEDLEKAVWYLQREIKALKGESGNGEV